METMDSLRNLVSGMGTESHDKSSHSQFVNRVISDVELEAAFESNSLARRIVKYPADDAFRKWREWTGEPDQIEKLERLESELGVQSKLRRAYELSRVWGGGALLIGDGSSDPSEPINVETAEIQYLTALSRLDLQADTIVEDITSDYFGRPEFYRVSVGTGGGQRIHASRLVLFMGEDRAKVRSGAAGGWGISTIQTVYSEVANLSSSSANVASLVFEANVDVFGVPGFMENVGSDSFVKRVLERFRLMSIGKSVNRAIVRDSEETFDRKQVSFAALPDVVRVFILLVSGAAQIPVTRLMGQSPSGLSATGEHDMKNYYEMIGSIQKNFITPSIVRLDRILQRQALGVIDDSLTWNWRSLDEPSETETVEKDKKQVETLEKLDNMNVFDESELRDLATRLVAHWPGASLKTEEKDGESVAPPEELALNGSQITSLREIVFAAATGQIPLESARGMIAASFPALEESQVTSILSSVSGFTPAPLQDEVFSDADPAPLYVRRDVLNSDQIAEWAVSQGFTNIAPDLHVTIVYSRTPVDWMGMGEPWTERLRLHAGGPRVMEKFGKHVVLRVASVELEMRHNQMVELGASHDFDGYNAHITITTDVNAPPLEDVRPYAGPIVLGPEIFEQAKP